MNKKIQLTGVAIVLSVLAIAAQNMAANGATGPNPNPTVNPSVAAIGARIWSDKAALRNIVFAPPGPEADPYLQHKAVSTVDPHVAAIGEKIWGDKAALRNIEIAPPGPEADLYLQHQSNEGLNAGLVNASN